MTSTVCDLECAAQDKASQAYDATAQAAHDATREPTTFEKAKGYMSPPSTADKVKGGAAEAYANAKVNSSKPPWRVLHGCSAHVPCDLWLSRSYHRVHPCRFTTILNPCFSRCCN